MLQTPRMLVLQKLPNTFYQNIVHVLVNDHSSCSSLDTSDIQRISSNNTLDVKDYYIPISNVAYTVQRAPEGAPLLGYVMFAKN